MNHDGESSDHFAEILDAGMAAFGFTPKQRQVFHGIRRGLRSKEIAQRMRLSERTIRGHASSMFDKANAENRPHLVNAVFVKGLRSPDGPD